MSAQLIFDLVPMGSVVAWSDGIPRPPERHVRKLSAWRTNNSSGRLVQKRDEGKLGGVAIPAGFTLHEVDFGNSSVIVLRVFRSFSVASSLRFAVVEQPKIGAVRVFDRPGPGQELVHLAASRAEAEDWLAHHGYPDAVLDEVGRFGFAIDETRHVLHEGASSFVGRMPQGRGR